MINEILKEIFSFRNSKRRENIDDLKSIYKLLGSPCKDCEIIHIAGTNGKGSTATFIENILIEQGHKVCKFTSPHILKYNERMVFNGEMISNDEITHFYSLVMETVKKFHSTVSEPISLNFFEITFFIALLFFESKNPDFIVLETGLGGRLDATNIIQSNISVITNVTFDHTSILGNTIQKIAYEKAGIIKDRQLCIFAQNSTELLEEIKKKTNNYTNVLEKYCYKISLNKKTFKTLVTINNETFKLSLFGKFQGENFLIAYEIAKIYNISDDIIKKALKNVRWQGRFEIFSPEASEPIVILDAAHNDDSIKKLYENLMEIYKKNEIIIITSLLETKDFKGVLAPLSNLTDKIFITSLKDIHYGLTADEIKEKMIANKMNIDNITFIDSIQEAYLQSKNIINKKETPYKAIVVCGSFYEISKFKSEILENNLF